METMEVKVQLDNLFNVLRENLFGNLGSRILYPVEIFFKNNSKTVILKQIKSEGFWFSLKEILMSTSARKKWPQM